MHAVREAVLAQELPDGPDRVEFGETDFQPILNKIMEEYNAEEYDAFFSLTVVIETPSIYKGLRALGMTIPIVTSPSCAHPAVFALGPEAVEGLMLIDSGGLANVAGLPDDWPLKAGQVEYAQRYEAEYGRGPDFFAAEGADSVTVMAEALRQAGDDDRMKVQQALLNITDLVGYTGLVTFSPELTAVGIDNEVVQWAIEDGQFVFVKTFLK